MNLELTDEQRLLVSTVRRFIDEHLAPLEEPVDHDGALAPETARDIFEKSRALGLYATNIPKEFGGGGLNAFDTMLLEEQFGRTSDILIRRAFGNVYEVLLRCTPAQAERWLLPSVRGERTCSIAITEPGAGSDAAGIKTRAVRDGDGWRLTGHKHYISDGLFSDFFVVSAVTDPGAGSRGISLFLVDKDSAGFTVGRDQPMMGLRGTSHIEMFFDDIRLGPENLLGEDGRGMRQVLETLGRVRLGQVGARAVGKAGKVLDLMVEHAQGREQFGQAIGNFQLVQQMLADSAIEINAARLLLWQAAAEIDRTGDGRELISMVKVHAAETLGRVVDRAVQLFGGAGFSKEHPIERYYRDARIYRIFDGTSEIHRTVLGGALLKKGTSLYDPYG
jgi:acyl-CoA dehydrogenase